MLSPTASAVAEVVELLLVLLFEMAWRASFVMEVLRLCRCCRVISLLYCGDFGILVHLVVDGMSSNAPRRISEHDRWGSIIVALLLYYLLAFYAVDSSVFWLGCNACGPILYL